MFIQEIFYVTTGMYKTRKELFIVYKPYRDSRALVVDKIISRDDMSRLMTSSNVTILPSLNVTPKEFKHHEEMRKQVG